MTHERPRELEDALNFHFYHPLAWRLAKGLARTPMTPNMVSVIGGFCVVGAAVAYAQQLWPVSALLGMALHMSWHIVDGADGDLARITGRASPIGEMVDGICDYASHFVLYLVLGWMLAHDATLAASIGLSPAASWLLMLAAGISHIVQANHVEVQRRSYQWWVYDKPWLRVTHERADASTRSGTLARLAGAYLGLASGVSSSARAIDEAVAASANDPARRDRIRLAARTEAGPLLQFLKVLGPNPRAIVLGLSMLAGSPLWYFAYQVVVLNLLLLRSIRLHETASHRMLALIDPAPGPAPAPIPA